MFTAQLHPGCLRAGVNALQISGADTELDKTVVEKISDPLMHLLRNAMDHGIESPAARLAAGKSATGVLKLNAYHDSGSIVIEIADDGAGLNTERILQKARERGLVAATAQPSEQAPGRDRGHGAGCAAGARGRCR